MLFCYLNFCPSQVSSWIQTLSILVQTVVCGYILYGWVLQSSDDQQNANNNNSGKKNDKLRRIFKRKKNPVPKEPKEKGKKGVHVPEIHIPDIHIYRQKGWTQYSRLDDDEEEDNNYNGDDEIVWQRATAPLEQWLCHSRVKSKEQIYSILHFSLFIKLKPVTEHPMWHFIFITESHIHNALCNLLSW